MYVVSKFNIHFQNVCKLLIYKIKLFIVFLKNLYKVLILLDVYAKIILPIGVI